MKKSLLLSLSFLLLSWAVGAQPVSREERFLNNYEAFVTEVVSTPVSAFHGDTLNHVKKMQRRYMRRYRWCYDTRLSLEQLEQFNKLCGRYQRKMKTVANRRRLAAAKGRIEGRWEERFGRQQQEELDTMPKHENFFQRLFSRKDTPPDTLLSIEPETP
ncbi:MAG: hypothetical protein J5641_06670 [Bacteroidales bacterium]|nr:hypothetical protein [Bacteroidales bacterium]